MKIIIGAKSVYPFHPFGGVQKYVYHFGKHLRQQGVEVEIVAPLDQGRPRSEEFEGLKYTLLWPSIFRYLERPVGWLGVHLFSIALAKYLKNKNFDLLHSFDMVGYRYAKMKNRKPVIGQIFSDNYLTNPISSSNPLAALSLISGKTDRIKDEKIKISPHSNLKTILRFPAQYFLKVKPMSEYLMQAEAIFLEDSSFQKDVDELFGLSAVKCDVLPVGVDTSFIDSRLENVKMQRHHFGLNDNDIVLLTVNRLAADKGVDKIITALPDIVKICPRVKLVVVGDGYQKQEIESLIDKKSLKDRVVLLHRVPENDLYSLYRLSDIYVCAFSYPGSSLSSLEAMACGLAVITTAQPWLIDRQNSGLLIKDNRPVTICEAVVSLIQEGQWKQKGRVAREVARRYDWRVIAESAIRKYDAIIKRS